MGVSQAAFRWEAEDEEDAGFARGINTASSRSANDAMNGSTATARFWRGGAGTRSQAQSWGSGWEARCVYRPREFEFSIQGIAAGKIGIHTPFVECRRAKGSYLRMRA